MDGAPAEAFVSRAGAWLRVRRIDLPRPFDPRSTRAFAGSYEVVGGDRPAVSALGGATVGTLTMHGTIAREVAAALAVTPDVYARVGADAKEVELALALAGDDFAFLGECQERLLTSPLREALGPDAAPTVRGFVGKTGAEVAAAFAPAPTRPAGALKAARLRLDPVPERWRGAYAICTRAGQRWNACVGLARPVAGPADTYYDPAAPALEIWLADASETPLARLGTVDLAALAEEAALPLDDGLTVVVTLSETSSPTAAAKGPGAGGRKHRPRRGQEVLGRNGAREQRHARRERRQRQHVDGP